MAVLIRSPHLCFSRVSKPSHLPCDPQSVKRYCEKIIRLPMVESVWLAGSRSPKHYKQHRVDSDWDLVLSVTSVFRIAQPRTTDAIHADLVMTMKSDVDQFPHAVPLYPSDPHNLLTGPN